MQALACLRLILIIQPFNFDTQVCGWVNGLAGCVCGWFWVAFGQLSVVVLMINRAGCDDLVPRLLPSHGQVVDAIAPLDTSGGRLAWVNNLCQTFLGMRVALLLFSALGWPLPLRVHILLQATKIALLINFAVHPYCQSKVRPANKRSQCCRRLRLPPRCCCWSGLGLGAHSASQPEALASAAIAHHHHHHCRPLPAPPCLRCSSCRARRLRASCLQHMACWRCWPCRLCRPQPSLCRKVRHGATGRCLLCPALPCCSAQQALGSEQAEGCGGRDPGRSTVPAILQTPNCSPTCHAPPPPAPSPPADSYSRRVSLLLFSWLVFDWLLPTLLLLPNEAAQRAQRQQDGAPSSGLRAIGSRLLSRLEAGLRLLLLPARLQQRQQEQRQMALSGGQACLLRWWAVLLLMWGACCSLAPLYVPPR